METKMWSIRNISGVQWTNNKSAKKFEMVKIKVKQESDLTRITLVNKLYVKVLQARILLLVPTIYNLFNFKNINPIKVL